MPTSNPNEIKAKTLMWEKWYATLYFLRTKPKCKDYGLKETMDSIWDKLPEMSKEYWLQRAL